MQDVESKEGVDPEEEGGDYLSKINRFMRQLEALQYSEAEVDRIHYRDSTLSRIMPDPREEARGAVDKTKPTGGEEVASEPVAPAAKHSALIRGAVAAVAGMTFVRHGTNHHSATAANKYTPAAGAEDDLFSVVSEEDAAVAATAAVTTQAAPIRGGGPKTSAQQQHWFHEIAQQHQAAQTAAPPVNEEADPLVGKTFYRRPLTTSVLAGEGLGAPNRQQVMLAAPEGGQSAKDKVGDKSSKEAISKSAVVQAQAAGLGDFVLSDKQLYLYRRF